MAAVIAAVTMLGAALAALAQDDLKRLLAWSTISQVAYMLGGVAVAEAANGSAAAMLHLLSHAAFKALLFLVAGCVVHLAGSTLLADMGGLRRTDPVLAGLFALGLAALAGAAAAVRVLVQGSGPGGRRGGHRRRRLAGPPRPGQRPAHHPRHGRVRRAGLRDRRAGRPRRSHRGDQLGRRGAGRRHRRGSGPHRTARAAALDDLVAVGAGRPDPPAGAGPAAPAGRSAQRPPRSDDGGHRHRPLPSVGLTWGLAAAARTVRDAALALPAALRLLLRDGYRLDAVQHAARRPALPGARRARAGPGTGTSSTATSGSVPVLSRWGSAILARAQSGLATGYVAWLAAGAVVAGLVGLVLS